MARQPTTAQRLRELETENERLRRSVDELSVLNELARSIGAVNDTQKIMHVIVRKAVGSLNAGQGDIMLLTEANDGEMSTLVRTGESHRRDDPYRINSSLMGWIQLYKKPLRINDPASDPRFQGSVWDPGIENVLCVPLMVRSRLIGILTVFNKKAPAGFTDEDQQLLAIIASQSAQVIDNARLLEEEKALTAMREELRLARMIQHSLLPDQEQPVPGYDIAGATRQAHEVGGDYYDVFPLDAHRVACCVGDASGKGLPAALFIANVQATLQGQALWSPSVSVCLDRVNHLLSQRIRKGLFATLFYGVLDARSHILSYANAGHNRPFVCRAGGAVERLDLGDVMLGFKPDYSYREDAVSLAPGDTILIFRRRP